MTCIMTDAKVFMYVYDLYNDIVPGQCEAAARACPAPVWCRTGPEDSSAGWLQYRIRCHIVLGYGHL